MLAVLLRRWRFVFLCVSAGLVIALLLTLLWKRPYESQTVLVPSSTSDASLSSQMLTSQLPAGILSLAGQPSSNQRLVGAIVRSRTLADSMVARFGLVPYGRSPEETEIREALTEADFQSNTDGSVVITVADSDPERAAEIANQFPVLVNVIMSGVAADAGERRRQFLEDQLALAQQRLQATEQRLVSFQQVQEAPEIQEQARQTLQAAAALQQDIMEQEVEVAQLRRSLTPDHPELRAAVFQLDALRSQLSRLTSGTSTSGDFFVPLGESPGLQVEFTRLLRDYTRDEQVYLSLTRALIEAQIDANNDVPVVSVLDPARVPTGRGGIPPMIAVPVGLLLGLFFGVAGAFTREYLSVARADPGNRRFFDAWEHFKSDLRPGRRQDRRGVPAAAAGSVEQA